MRKIRSVMSAAVAAALTISMAAVASAQSASPGAPAAPLAGTSWTLSSGDIAATLQIDARLAGGFAGCNQYLAAVTSMDPGLTFGEIASTLMACPEPQMTFEQQYLEALATVADYSIAGQTLTLLDATGAAVLVYQAGAPASIERAWVVTGYNNGKEAVVTPPEGSVLTADFAPDGTVSGASGCNSFSGGYSHTADTIAIGPLMSTMMACEEPANSVEQQYLAALQNATVWTLTNGVLELRDDSGALQVSFVRP